MRPIGTLLGMLLGLIGTVLGIREAAEVDTGKAVLIGIVAFVVLFVVGMVLGIVFAAIGI